MEVSQTLAATDLILTINRKHLYADLQPYTCFYRDCEFNTKPFSSRQVWADHLDLEHKFGPAWGEVQCPLCSSATGTGKNTILTHFARHMEDIALVALPPAVESDDESDASVQSSDSIIEDRGSLLVESIRFAQQRIIDLSTLENEDLVDEFRDKKKKKKRGVVVEEAAPPEEPTNNDEFFDLAKDEDTKELLTELEEPTRKEEKAATAAAADSGWSFWGTSHRKTKIDPQKADMPVQRTLISVPDVEPEAEPEPEPIRIPAGKEASAPRSKDKAASPEDPASDVAASKPTLGHSPSPPPSPPPIPCRYSSHHFKIIKSDTALVVWMCNRCHSGPFTWIYECDICRVKICRPCAAKS